MSVNVLTWVLDQSTATGNDRLVLIAIADEADYDGSNAYPSVDRIAKRGRLNKRTVLRAIERLEASGELVVERPKVHGRGHHNVYRVVIGNGDTLSVEDSVDDRETVRKGAPRGALDPLTQVPEPSSSEPDGSGREDVEALCSILVASMVERGLRHPTVTKRWRDETRRLLDVDKVACEEAERVLRWAVRDSFWSQNILSMPTFREKFDQLRLKSDVSPVRRGVEESVEWRLMQPGAIKVRP